jgi:Cellulase (glycosyl hydrolase family 5)
MALGAALGSCGGGSAGGSPPIGGSPTAAVGHCFHPVAPFRVVGNHLVDARGHDFIPYGMTINGLAHPGWQAHVGPDLRHIRATATTWCANTVRIQAAPSNLLAHPSSGRPYNRAFLAALMAQVTLARRLGLAVVLTAQTEDTTLAPGPTTQTIQYWRVLEEHLQGQGGIMFDLFNEPRLWAGSVSRTWMLWQKGGRYHGVSYLGMQTLANRLRRDHIGRIFWIEGPFVANALPDQLLQHEITGENMVYDVHHPRGTHSPRNWWEQFGELSVRVNEPVVLGEWAQYAAPKTECWPDARRTVPAFLQYLHVHKIGLVVWALKPGVLVQRTGNGTTPTVLKANYACRAGLDQGAGALIQQYFHRYNTVR